MRILKASEHSIIGKTLNISCTGLNRTHNLGPSVHAHGSVHSLDFKASNNPCSPCMLFDPDPSSSPSPAIKDLGASLPVT